MWGMWDKKIIEKIKKCIKNCNGDANKYIWTNNLLSKHTNIKAYESNTCICAQIIQSKLTCITITSLASFCVVILFTS